LLLFGNAEALPSKDLTLTIAAEEPQVCRGATHVNLTAEVTNNRKEAIAVRFDSVGQIVSFHPAPKIKPGESRVNVGSVRVIPLKDESGFTVLDPGLSFKRDLIFKVPVHTPSETKQLEIFITFYAKPSEKRNQNVQTFRGDVQSNKIKLDLVECKGP